MKKLLILLALLVAGSAQAQYDDVAPAQPGSAGRSYIGASPRYYSTMDGQFGAYGDAQQAWALLAVTSGTNTLSVGPGVTTCSTNVTLPYGSNTLTTSGSCFNIGNQIDGVPISITGATSGGGTLNTAVVYGVSTTQASLANPGTVALSASAQTVIFGSYFTSADAAKTIFLPGAGSAGALLQTTFTVTDANHIVLGTNASTTLSAGNLNNWNQITWCHDDSAAVNAAITAALARGDRYLYVPNNHCVPTLSPLIAYLIPFGEGHFYQSPIQRYVIPPNAPQATAPTNSIVPSTQLTALAATSTPIFCDAGDSLWQMGNDPAMMEQALPTLQAKFAVSNSSKKFTFYDRAIGGQTYATFDTVSNTFPSWYTNTSKPWLGWSVATGYIYELNCDSLFMGFGNNDALNFSASAFLDSQAKIERYSKVPDRIIGMQWAPSPMATTHPEPDTSDYVAMFLRTYAETRGLAYLDFNRQSAKVRDGYDPLGNALTAAPCFNDYANTRLAMPYTAPSTCLTTGYDFQLGSVDATLGPTFWAHYGNELQFGLSRVAGNVFRMGYDISADNTGRIGSLNLYYECDISLAYPGAGCAGGTVPTVLTNISITSGANSLTSSIAVFTPADACVWMTIPGAGTSGNYLVAYANYVSTTNVTLFSDSGCTVARNAATTLTANNQVVLRGNPKIQTSINISGESGTPTKFEIAVSGDTVTAWYRLVNENFFFRGPAIRYGGTFLPTITPGAGSFPLGLANFGSTNPATFIEQPSLNWPSLTSLEMNGPYTGTPTSNGSYVGAQGGEGGNHPASPAWGKIIRPVIDAINVSTLNALGGGAAPVIASGFGTSPMAPTTSAAAFSLTIGSGGTAATGVLTMPTAKNGWLCNFTDQTSKSAAVSSTQQTANSTTSVTLGNFTDLSASGPWNAGDVILGNCQAY